MTQVSDLGGATPRRDTGRSESYPPLVWFDSILLVPESKEAILSRAHWIGFAQIEISNHFSSDQTVERE